MNSSTNAPVSPPVSSGTASPPAQLLPEDIVSELRLLRAQFPDYVQLPLPSAKSLRGVANVHPAFVQLAISATGASATLQAAIGRSAADMQQESELPARLLVVADELQAMLKGVLAGVLVRKHSVALSALQAYSIGRQLVRKPENADLLPHVQAMTRLRRAGRRAVATPPQPPTPPAHGLLSQQEEVLTK
jgi:hypothetical protein